MTECIFWQFFGCPSNSEYRLAMNEYEKLNRDLQRQMHISATDYHSIEGGYQVENPTIKI